MNNLRFLKFFIVGFFSSLLGWAQESETLNQGLAGFDLSFVHYLMDNKEYGDAIVVMRSIEKGGHVPAARLDSVHLLMARAYYLQEKIDSSIRYFSMVSSTSPHFSEASLFHAFGLMYQTKHKEAEAMLETLSPNDSVHQEFIRFMRASNALMQRDFASYRAQSQQFRMVCRSSEWEQKQLPKWEEEQIKNRRKSAWKAGIMSALMPGSGKYYAGYRGQAIATLIPCLIFGAAGVESYFRAGPNSFPFIASTSLFGLFYLGNIWGSALSVKTLYEQRDREIRHHLLLDVQIPIHRLFGQ